MNPHALFELPRARAGWAVVAIGILDWISRAQTAMNLWYYLLGFWEAAWTPPLLIVIGFALVLTAVIERPSEATRQWNGLTLIERIALRICTQRHGITDEHLADYMQSIGLPRRTDVFSAINRTALLIRDATTGQWSVKPEFRKNIERLSQPSRAFSGIL